MQRNLSVAIALSMLLGVLAGAWLHQHPVSILTPVAAASLPVATDLFLRLIKMVIGPLVLSTLIAGIAHMEDVASLGRIGLRALLWFLAASVVSLFLGLLSVSLLQPGAGAHLALPTASTALAHGGMSPQAFITHIVPTSIVQALAENEVLQIVIFSTLAGVALTAIGPSARPLVRAMEALSAMMLKMTGYIMWAAPLAVFSAIAAAIAAQGLDMLWIYGRFIAGFYGTLLLFWVLVLVVGACFTGPGMFRLPRLLREPLLIAFSTASSEAALAPTLEALERFGVPSRVAGFVVPLGYSFNLDGSMMYCTFAAMFIAQACDIPLTLSQTLAMLATFLVTSKGIAGVPRASLVVLAATLPRFGIPESGVLIVLGVDHFLDMGRTATNVIGNAVAASVIGRGEVAGHHPSARPVEATSPPFSLTQEVRS